MEELDGAPAARVILIPGGVVDVRGILLRHQRRADHHVRRADVAILHVALLRIDDLHELRLRMELRPRRLARRSVDRPLVIKAFRANGGGAVADIRDGAVAIGAHDILLVVLMALEGGVELGDVSRHPHRVELLIEPNLLGVGAGTDIGDLLFHVGLADHRPEVGVVGGLRHRLGILDGKRQLGRLHRSPLVVVAVLEPGLGAELDPVDIGGVGAAGGQRPAGVFVVADRHHRRANEGVAVGVHGAGVEARFVEDGHPLPCQMRIGEKNGAAIGGALRRHGPLV